MMRRRRVLLLGRWILYLGRRGFCLGIVGVALWVLPGSPAVFGSRIFINWWRSSPFLLSSSSPFLPLIVTLAPPLLDDIMFSKHLRDEHRGAQTLPATRSSKGTPSSSDQKGKRAAPTLPVSSSKRSRPSSSAFLRM
ncbi:UNVERIFIED_CONTAM: hypothetical protein Slati_1949400 [Sesamum latifolium]|uniref:Uncharacterized protein n=1 Tax=Sesamum latifolium TaxID=2727402 RepID=A0AAW2X7Q4_9LAMI